MFTRSSLTVLAVSVVTAFVLGSGAQASFRAQQQNNQNFASATTSLVLSNVVKKPGQANLQIGTNTYQTMTLKNEGTVTLAEIMFRTSGVSDNVLSNSGTRGSEVRVLQCNVTWNADGSCSSGQRARLTSPAFNLKNAAMVNISNLAPGQEVYLKVQYGLVPQRDVVVNGVPTADSPQGLSNDFYGVFSASQLPGSSTRT